MNVLVVNDDPISLQLQKLIVKSSRIANSIITADNGKKAIEFLQKFKDENLTSYPKLILLDIHMPVMNGWEFLDQFMKDFAPIFPDTQVVITSYTVDKRELSRAEHYPVVVDFQNIGLTAGYLTQYKHSGNI